MAEDKGDSADEFDYFAWRKLAETFPCAPAKGLPKLTDSESVVLRRLSPTLLPTEVAFELEAFIKSAIEKRRHLCVATVPSWRTEEDVARAAASLRDDHGWTLKRLSRGVLAQQPFIRVGLHRTISYHPRDGRPIESVPMVLGNFPQFPVSRHCPASIFEMSVCVDGETKLIDGKHRINFLGIPLTKLSEAQREVLIQKAKDETILVNGGADARAKPNVTATFTLPIEPLLN